MARKQRDKKVIAQVEVGTKPVRVDLRPEVHKALRRRAADLDMSMAALARKMIAECLGFKDREEEDE